MYETDDVVLAVELRRVWNCGAKSGNSRGVRRSGSDDASDMATSVSVLVLGNWKRLGLFADCDKIWQERSSMISMPELICGGMSWYLQSR